jgi:integrase
MGTKKGSKGAVSIENIDNRIRLRWRHQSKRYSLSLFLFSKTNLIQAKRIAATIEKDIVFESFDETLKKYKPEVKQEPVYRKTLVEHFEHWVKNYRNMDCEMHIDYNSTRNMMLRWGKFGVNEVLKCLNAETFNGKTYNRRLSLLIHFFKWAKKNKFVSNNPLEDVLPKKSKKTPKQARKPFTEDEIKKVLEAVKSNQYCPKSSRYSHSHYYPFLYFIFKTGVRNAEAVGFRVQHIDFQKKVIHIKEVLARTLKGTHPNARVRKETKNSKQRMLPLTDDLEQILLPLVQGKAQDDLVFLSHTGIAIDDSQFQKRIFRKVLEGLQIPVRDLYACRHTFGSRCIHNGMTPVMTAFLMGNNPETALRNYTHLLELPKDLPKI